MAAKKKRRRSLVSRIRKYTRPKAIARMLHAWWVRIPRPETVPMELTGKWIAWSSDGLRIIAAGDSPTEARAAAEQAGVFDAMFEWVPPKEQLRSVPHTQRVSGQ
jgi:hypothetical protein